MDCNTSNPVESFLQTTISFGSSSKNYQQSYSFFKKNVAQKVPLHTQKAIAIALPQKFQNEPPLSIR